MKRRSFLLYLTFLVFEVYGVHVELEDGKRGIVEKEIKLFTNEILVCSAVDTTSSTPSIEWYYKSDKSLNGEGRMIVSGSRVVENFVEKFSLNGASITFKNTTKTDTGVYKCRIVVAEDENSADSGLYDVTIVYPPSKPFCQYPSEKSLTRGFEQELKCNSAEGVPRPQYRWYRNGELLPEESSSDPNYKNATFSYDTASGILRFMEVNDANAGSYYCEASNSQASIQCDTFTLTIHDQNVAEIVGIVFGVVILIALICLAIFVLWKKGFLSGSDREEDYVYDMNEEGSNDVMLDGDEVVRGKQVSSSGVAASSASSVRRLQESSMMI